MNFLIGLLFAFLLELIGIAFYATGKTTEQYTQQCTSFGGKAVFNGKHWECIK